jgi:hypothetical protein
VPPTRDARIRAGGFSLLLCRGLLSCGAPLEYALRPLELGAPSRAEILPATIDEVLNHPDSGTETARRHILARHCPGDLGRGAGKGSSRWMRGIGGDAAYPLPLPAPASRWGRRHGSSQSGACSLPFAAFSSHVPVGTRARPKSPTVGRTTRSKSSYVILTASVCEPASKTMSSPPASARSTKTGCP